MKSVLVSLKPYYYYLVGEGIKKIEVRKDMPKASDWNKEVLFYMSKDVKSFAKIPKEFQEKYRKHFGKVGMQFVCDRIVIFEKSELGIKINDFFALAESCLKVKEMREYIGENKIAYGWHISDLKIYDEPKELGNFFTPMGKRPSYMIERPPQSYMYVEEL